MGGTLGCAGDRYAEKDPNLQPYGLSNGKPVSPTSDSTSSQESHSPTWKFWHRFTLRRGGKGSSKHSKSDLDLQNANVTESDTPATGEEKNVFRRSNSLKAPPKPPRLFLFRSSSIGTPRNSVVGNSDRNSFVMSQAYQNARAKDNIPTAHVVPVRQENSPVNTNNSQQVTENNNLIEKSDIIEKTENLTNVSKDSENNEIETTNSNSPDKCNSVEKPGRIKIVTPDLTPRRNLNRARKSSVIVPQNERHRLIIQSALELLCQKLDPSGLLDDLLDQKVISAVDVQAFRGHPDRRLVCESLLQILMDGKYSQFVSFCDVLKHSKDFQSMAVILDAMRDTYDVIYNIQAADDEEPPVLEEEKSVVFEVGYFNFETGIMKPIVELDRTRDINKRYSRDSLFFKRASRLSYTSMSSEGAKIENNELEIHGIPMVNICISGHCMHGDRSKGLAEVLNKYECILGLRVGKTQLSGKDVGYLAMPLQSSSSLTVLDLRLNQIGNEGARLLSAPLQKNAHLRQLNISSTGIDHEGCKHLADALKQNSALTELDMSFLEMGDSGCICLGNMLKQNKALNKLRLRSCSISWIGCGILFEGVQQSKSLTELDLSRNFIGDDGMEMMCRHLSEKSALTDLNLENCQITSVGCTMLSDVILMNKTMLNLDLSVNFIGDSGISKLSAALERNKTIKTIGLNMCGITNDGFAKLLDILEVNPTLTLLKLCYNRLGREFTNPSATSDDLRYRVRIVTSSNPKLKLLLWGNAFDES